MKLDDKALEAAQRAFSVERNGGYPVRLELAIIAYFSALENDMTNPAIKKLIELGPELEREKANRVAKHWQHARDDIVLDAISALSVASDAVSMRRLSPLFSA